MSNGESFGGSNDRANRTATEHIARLVREVQGDDTMLLKFVLITETMDGDDRWLAAYTSLDMRAWETLGLLAYAQQLENSRIHLAEIDDKDDE